MGTSTARPGAPEAPGRTPPPFSNPPPLYPPPLYPPAPPLSPPYAPPYASLIPLLPAFYLPSTCLIPPSIPSMGPKRWPKQETLIGVRLDACCMDTLPCPASSVAGGRSSPVKFLLVSDKQVRRRNANTQAAHENESFLPWASALQNIRRAKQLCLQTPILHHDGYDETSFAPACTKLPFKDWIVTGPPILIVSPTYILQFQCQPHRTSSWPLLHGVSPSLLHGKASTLLLHSEVFSRYRS